MARLLMGDVWDDTRKFVIRERALLVPLSLATFGVASAILMFVTPEQTPGKPMQTGPWMYWLVPVLLIMQLGYLSIAALTLKAGASVREAVQRAFQRMSQSVIAFLLIGMSGLGFMFAGGLIGQLVGRAMGLAVRDALMLATMLALIPILWLAVRLALIWATLADRQGGALDSVRFAYRLTGGLFWRIAGAMMAGFAAYLLLTIAVQLGAGSVLLLIGKATGFIDAARIILLVLVAGFGAICAAVWTVFFAILYRQLSASSKAM